MQMMVSVFRGPPQYAFLREALREKCKDELKYPACRIGPMREVAMIAGADCENAQPVEREAKRTRSPGDAGPDGGKAGEMNAQEWQAYPPVDSVSAANFGGFVQAWFLFG